MDTIKALVIEPLRRPELRDIDPTITAIGETIGGYAEPLPLDRRTTLWCDEEGAIKNLKPNRTIRPARDASRTLASPSSSAARSSSRDPTRRTAPSDSTTSRSDATPPCSPTPKRPADSPTAKRS